MWTQQNQGNKLHAHHHLFCRKSPLKCPSQCGKIWGLKSYHDHVTIRKPKRAFVMRSNSTLPA
jgi:hypothetical protein